MNNSTVNVTTLQPHEELILQMCVHAINLMFGFPANSYIIWLIITGTKSGIASGFFNMNFSVCEIGICLNSLLVLCFYFLQFSGLLVLKNFLSGLGITGRPLFQCLICVERYLAVIHPVIFLKFKPLRYRAICCTASWIICLGSCCTLSAVSSNYVSFVWIYSVQFLVFLSIQLFCCLAVLRALKQSGPGERGREREEENNMKRRAFILILITTVTTVITYLPFTVAGFFYVLSQRFIAILFSLSYLLFVLAGFIQPLFYLHWAGKLCCLCSK